MYSVWLLKCYSYYTRILANFQEKFLLSNEDRLRLSEVQLVWTVNGEDSYSKEAFRKPVQLLLYPVKMKLKFCMHNLIKMASSSAVLSILPNSHGVYGC